MISDLDGIIRANPEINIRQFISLCDNIKLKNTALSILALAKKWFDTPIVIDLTFADRSTQPLYETLSSAIIEGCVFGSDSAIKNNIKMSFFEKIIDRIKRFFMRLFSGGRMNIDKTPVRVRGGEFSEYERIIFKELSIKQRQKR